MHDIRSFIPHLFTQPRTLLYIGCRPDAHSWLDELLEVGHRVTVLEIWEPNAQGLLSDSRLEEVILGDVRDIWMLSRSYDYIVWWHGPEHIEKGEFYTVIEQLENKANILVALACPYGLYPQGSHEGNLAETHRWSVYPQDLRGYNIKTDGETDKPGSEIVGYKIIK